MFTRLFRFAAIAACLAMPVAAVNAADPLLHLHRIPGQVVVDHEMGTLKADAFPGGVGGDEVAELLVVVLDAVETRRPHRQEQFDLLLAVGRHVHLDERRVRLGIRHAQRVDERRLRREASLS